ncbi:hypothetical protein [Fodinibius halophilus]|uniref:hypothetical protein n=1 Tax=Fodinibius halophilus TaxID=1736908 RepID=UPI00197AB95A|nr:hypothetical protein [Fodinibius halophilus]
MNIALIVGNGLTIDLIKKNDLSIDTSKPLSLSFDVPLNSGKNWKEAFPIFFELYKNRFNKIKYCSRYCKTDSDFDFFEFVSEEYLKHGDIDIDCEARQFLSFSYSYLQTKIVSRDLCKTRQLS